MPSLNEQLQSMGFENIPFVNEHKTTLERWAELQNPLFIRACENKPNVAPELHLLGVLTKSHIETCALYEQHAVSTQLMQDVLSDTLGESNAAKFSNQSAQDLVLVTHLWMYVQGYLNMDFSLAHDHAEQTQKTLQQERLIKKRDVDAFRSDLMQSFYLGKAANEEKTGGLIGWLKRLFT